MVVILFIFTLHRLHNILCNTEILTDGGFLYTCTLIPVGSYAILPPANEVWGKVIFSQASVCPQEGGGWQTPPRETPLQADAPPGRHPSPGQTPLQETATEAGGTHPTGMHSFSEVFRLYQVSVIDVHCNIMGVGVELVCSKCANHNLPGKRIAGHNMTLT